MEEAVVIIQLIQEVTWEAGDRLLPPPGPQSLGMGAGVGVHFQK